ncbi:ATP-binding cassette domain-containing protein [Mesorhizobium abyssinicae]|uniref:ATP-binding cassette domain-containing protein n=1 Tax=Mesorhizobium abyssinicae TaxID=1209958 RepID=A0ABU5AX13_9HYPH|nr:ATP-binding cassette domain-containing protein [Mesorhizobium abyssinicae]MDX8541876.1 ATP-binding cassette domain-containing protein [Mesorhizobium abyssinicae]
MPLPPGAKDRITWRAHPHHRRAETRGRSNRTGQLAHCCRWYGRGCPAIHARRVHGIISAQQKETYVSDLLGRVGLDASVMRRYPHQFSGGQRARIGVARALAVNPAKLVCDEATAALDVSIQAQIINLFVELREEFDRTYLIVSHDLGVVAHVADRVAVMYLAASLGDRGNVCVAKPPLHGGASVRSTTGAEEKEVLRAQERDSFTFKAAARL